MQTRHGFRKERLLFLAGLCMAFFIALLPVSALKARAQSDTATTGSGTREDPYVVYNWEELKAKMAAGGYIRLGEDAVDSTKTSDSLLVVSETSPVVLDLNGHMINRGLTQAVLSGSVISVHNGNLTITDGSAEGNGCITGGNTTGNGGAVNVVNATFELCAGLITGNHADGLGGGISIENGTVKLNGGSVLSNTAGGSGGGMSVDAQSELFVTGEPLIAENSCEDQTNNLRLPEDFRIAVPGDITDGAHIGITTDAVWEGENTLVLTSGFSASNDGEDPSGYFVSDNPDYEIGLDEEFGEVVMSRKVLRYYLWVAGKQVNIENKDDLTYIKGVSITGDGYAVYDSHNNILKLKNVTICGSAPDDASGSAICYDGPDAFRIELSGNNHIADSAADSDVLLDRTTFSAGLAIGRMDPSYDSNRANVEIVADKGSKTEFIGANARESETSASCGLFHRGDGTITIRGEGEVDFTGNKGAFTYGIVSGGIIVIDKNVSINVTTKDDNTNDSTVKDGEGISAHEVTVNGGNLNINVGGAKDIAFGISTGTAGNITFNGGNTNVILGNANDMCIGIYTDNTIAVNDGTLEISVNYSGNTDYLRALNKPPVFGERVSATASVNPDGLYSVEYKAEDNNTYRWFKSTIKKPDVDDAFEDVDADDWFYPFVKYVYDRGIMTGKNGRFAPNDPITREEFTQVLYSHSGKPEVSIDNPFEDVKDGWYKNSVLWAKENGIADGSTKDGKAKFGVGRNINREEMAVMLYKYAVLRGYNMDRTAGITDGYTDADKLSTWAKEALEWAVTQGIISGKSVSATQPDKMRLDPKGSAKRAECATMIMRLLEKN